MNCSIGRHLEVADVGRQFSTLVQTEEQRRIASSQWRSNVARQPSPEVHCHILRQQGAQPVVTFFHSVWWRLNSKMADVGADEQGAPFKLSYVDFAPQCAGAGGVICRPEYERFDVLVSKANEWLNLNPRVRVKTCESIEVKGRLDGIVDTNKSCYFEADHAKRRMRNIYIRALRLWVIPKDDTSPQQIGYVNVVPCRNELGLFERFGDTVRRFNRHLRQRPLPGCILNIESQEMKFHEWGMGVDPDESCWVESVKYNVSFLVVIRVFYELGCSACEEIGCADFMPARVNRNVSGTGSSVHSVVQFESFREVLRKASGWIHHQDRIRVTNIQSIDYKIKPDSVDVGEIDSQRSFYVESGRKATRYLRIVRVGFVKPFDGRQVIVERPLAVDYITFEPLILSSGGIFGIPLFETITQTMKRAIIWLNQTSPDLEIMSAETVPVRMYSGNQYGNHEVTYTWNRGEQKEFWLLVVRIYASAGSGYLDDGVLQNDYNQHQSAAAAAACANTSGDRHHSNTSPTDDKRTVCCTVS